MFFLSYVSESNANFEKRTDHNQPVAQSRECKQGGKQAHQMGQSVMETFRLGNNRKTHFPPSLES